jgi:hypothetical protein
MILAGHGRYLAALELGLPEVPVMTLADLSETEKRALALADNKVALNAGWDRGLLARELGELADLLPECKLDLEITGFEAAEIDGLLGDLLDPEHDQADDVPPPQKAAVTRPGDLWELGPHRLLCGAAQSAMDVGRLMGTDAATMLITDPPYNVPIRRVQGRGRIKHRNFTQGGGEFSREESKGGRAHGVSHEQSPDYRGRMRGSSLRLLSPRPRLPVALQPSAACAFALWRSFSHSSVLVHCHLLQPFPKFKH